MKYKIKIPLISLLLLLSFIVKAQREIPIKFSLLTEQVSLPTFNEDYGSNWRYGFSLGSEYVYSKKSKKELVQTADFYFFSHRSYGSSFILASLFDFRYKPGRFNMDIKLGPGYMLFYNYSPVYKQVDGTYIEVSRLQSKFSAILSVAFSYKFRNFRPFVSYDMLTETPFINNKSIFLPHQILQVGCYYNLKTK